MALAPEELAKFREQLTQLKAELEKRVDRIHDHARNPLNADSAEQAAELGNVAVVSALESEAIEEIEEIKSALQRLDAGEYGICVSCGELINQKRLEARPEIRLGQVTVDGRPQFITRLHDSERQGVEVRRGSINLNADSRYQGDIANLPAVGWEHDFRQVGATLHLPPGWELFSAAGIDNVPPTWLQRWTLLDLFLVLIAALAINHLWGWR